MWLRIATYYQVVGVPQVLVRYRTHGANMTKDLQRMEEARRAVIAKNFGQEEGDPQTWPDLRRRAYGGLYLRTALDHFELGEVENGQLFLQNAFEVYPELAENLEAFYELGCAYQPRGFRDTLEPQAVPGDARFLLDALDKIFEAEVPENLGSRKNQAYAYANFASGLLAYRRQEISLARNHLARALRLYPGLVRHPQLMPTLAKTLIGERTIRLLKRSASNGG